MHFPHISLASVLRWILLLAAVPTFGATETIPRNSVNHLYRIQLSTGHIVASTWHGAQAKGATRLAEERGKGWTLIGAAQSADGISSLVYSNKSTGALAVSVYGGVGGGTLMGSASLPALDPGWKPQAVADLAGDGNLDVIATHESTGQVGIYSFGGVQGTTLLKHQIIDSLSAPGWDVIGAADLNGDGRPDLILQHTSTREVMFAYLDGSKNIAVTATQILSGSDFRGWTASGMLDMNGDGHPDLILSNDATGAATVNYYGGDLGVAYLGSDSVDQSGSRDWKLVVPTSVAKSSTSDTKLSTDVVASVPQALASLSSQTTTSTWSSATPVLIFNGSGTGATAVAAIESVVHSMGLAYHTANSSQLDQMSQSKLASYKLFIVPGGNSITIGNHLTSKATTTVRSAISQNGLNYLGLCAGGFWRILQLPQSAKSDFGGMVQVLCGLLQRNS